MSFQTIVTNLRAARIRKKRAIEMRLRPKQIGYFMIIPLLIHLSILTLYPSVFSIYLSLTSYDLLRPREYPFVGLKNYIEGLRNPVFWNSLKVTLIYAAVAVSSEFLLGLGFALLVNKWFRRSMIIRTLFIIPLVLTPVIAGLMWRFMYEPKIGLISFFLRNLGFEEIVWLGNPTTALIAVIIVDVWQQFPFMFLIFLAGVTSLPQPPFEAADLDGASSWQKFRHITIPMLTPIMLLGGIFRTFGAFNIFDTIFVVTQGGPGYSTEMIGVLLFDIGFDFRHVGEAAALSIIVNGIVLALSVNLIMLLFRQLGRGR